MMRAKTLEASNNLNIAGAGASGQVEPVWIEPYHY